MTKEQMKKYWYIASLMQPLKALSYLRKRSKLITSDEWNQLKEKSHSKAFTAANVTKADILQFIYDAVLKAKEEGWTVQEFQENLIPMLQQNGWYGSKNKTENKQLSKHHLKIILETNMKTSFSQGQVESKKAIAKYRPYWIYKQLDRKNKNLSHVKFHNKVFRHDDPIWASIYPPSQFGCGCHVRAMSEQEIKDKGLSKETGKEYETHIKNNAKEFQIKVLQDWKPDYSKYNNKIKSQLMKAVNDYKKVNQKN